MRLLSTSYIYIRKLISAKWKSTMLLRSLPICVCLHECVSARPLGTWLGNRVAKRRIAPCQHGRKKKKSQQIWTHKCEARKMSVRRKWSAKQRELGIYTYNSSGNRSHLFKRFDGYVSIILEHMCNWAPPFILFNYFVLPFGCDCVPLFLFVFFSYWKQIQNYYPRLD